MVPFARWPRRRTYPLAGLLLALGLPAGLVALHGVVEHLAGGGGAVGGAASWATRELLARPLTYGYLLVCGATMLVLLGWMLGRREDQLEALSVTDSLTGLANRRRLVGAVGEELLRADRYGTPLALLIVDVDHLKQVNDRAGHTAGDRALAAVADAMRRSCRATDLPARVGGDELAVLASSTTAAEAVTLAERIRASLPPSLSVSIGVADLDGAAAETVEALYIAADQALYRAKTAGRDQVAIAPPRALRTSSASLGPVPTPRRADPATGPHLDGRRA